MKGYCIACLFLFLNICTVSWGQVPPYQHSVTKTQGPLVRNILFFRSVKPYIDFTPHFNDDAFLCTIREEIPFYTLLTYPSLDDYYLEYYYKAFNYRQFKSFTAPKGVNKITYYLGNNLIDSTEVAQHTFFFNKKTLLLEKEIKDQKNMKSSFTRDLVDQEVYLYKYEELENEYVVKKFLQFSKEENLLETFTYSKDKTRLLKTEFYQWEKMRELLNYTYNVKPILQQAFFCYNESDELEYAFFNEEITTDGSNLKKNIDYRKDFDNRDKWKKSYWVSQFNITEQNSEKMKFPIIDNFEAERKVLRFVNTFDAIDNSKSQEFEQNGLLWRTKNIFDFDYSEILAYSNPIDSGESYLTYVLLLFDEKNKFNIGMIRRQTYFAESSSLGTFTLVSKILISSCKKSENDYFVKRIDTSGNRGGIEYSEEYSIKLKSKKGLKELYLNKDKQEYPLIIIN